MESTGGFAMVNSEVKFCTVTLSEVIYKGKRLEASVYDIEAKHVRNIIEHGKFPVKMLCGAMGFASSYICGRFKRIWLKKSDIPIYQPSSITDIYPMPDGYLSHKTQTDIDALRVHRGQVLVTRSGSIGKISYVSKTLDNQVFSDDLLRIDCNISDDAGYIYAYLKSAIGNKILLTNSYGSVITHIEPEHLDAVPVPDAPTVIKKRINDLIVGSYALRDASNTLIDKATSLLAQELHFFDIHDFNVVPYEKNADVDTFIVKLSNISGRLDASYHVPIVNTIVEHMKKYAAEVTTIKDSRVSKTIILAGVFKRTYVEEDYGYPFLGGKEITQLSPKIEKFLSRAIHKSRYEKELKVEENMILVSDRGTIGITALVPRHWDGWAVSQNVLKIVPVNNDIAGYLLNSDMGHILVRRQTYGFVVDMIDNHSLEDVEVPLLKNTAVQMRINELALEANKKRYEAYKLEQDALKIIDEEIIK